MKNITRIDEIIEKEGIGKLAKRFGVLFFDEFSRERAQIAGNEHDSNCYLFRNEKIQKIKKISKTGPSHAKSEKKTFFQKVSEFVKHVQFRRVGPQNDGLIHVRKCYLFRADENSKQQLNWAIIDETGRKINEPTLQRMRLRLRAFWLGTYLTKDF